MWPMEMLRMLRVLEEEMMVVKRNGATIASPPLANGGDSCLGHRQDPPLSLWGWDKSLHWRKSVPQQQQQLLWLQPPISKIHRLLHGNYSKKWGRKIANLKQEDRAKMMESLQEHPGERHDAMMVVAMNSSNPHGQVLLPWIRSDSGWRVFQGRRVMRNVRRRRWWL